MGHNAVRHSCTRNMLVGTNEIGRMVCGDGFGQKNARQSDVRKFRVSGSP